MTAPLAKVQIHGAAATVTLNRPEKRNALSRDLLAELSQAFFDLHQERRVRAVILAGAGSVFCAGMDLAEMQAARAEADAHARWQEDVLLYRELLETMLRFPKPIIAAVGGPALAGGAGLVLACDIVVASPEATIGLPEPRRGLVAAVVAPLLTFRIGCGQAAYLMLTSQPQDAAWAHRVGIVHEVVDSDKIWARAVQLAEQCAEGAPESLLLTKRMLNETIGEQIGTLLSAGAAASAAARTTEAADTGLTAFLEKRKPQW